MSGRIGVITEGGRSGDGLSQTPLLTSSHTAQHDSNKKLSDSCIFFWTSEKKSCTVEMHRDRVSFTRCWIASRARSAPVPVADIATNQRLVSLICLFLIAVLRLVGGATNAAIIQIHDDLIDVAQEAVNTGCGAAFIPGLGAREQAASGHSPGARGPQFSLLTTCNTCNVRAGGIHPARVEIRRTQNQEDDQNLLRGCDRCGEPDV